MGEVMDQPRTQSFANVSYDEAMRRAADLIPFLREQAAAVEQARRLTPEVVAELHRTGLLRYLQPRSWGGMELDFVAWSDIPEMLGRGDASVAWSVANLASHHRTLAVFPEEAQREVWEDDPDAMIAAGIAYQQGRARRVDGGIVLSGKWNFCSVVKDSAWSELACMVMDGDKPVDWAQCLLKRDQYEIIDDWQVMGMRGTGSCSVKVDELFVPDYRVQSMAVGLPGHSFAGLKDNPNPMYRIPTSGLGPHGLAASIVGAAQGALDVSIDWVKQRSTNTSGAKMRDYPTLQLRFGVASAKIDAARLILRNDCLHADGILKAGETVPLEAKLSYKRNACMAVRIAVEAVDCLHEAAGANGIYDHAPLQRMFRDVRSASAHIHFSTDMQMTAWGNVALGGTFSSPTM
jgi:3-hydroxy-9,10-secoandrosta-1,3,5(10)-triene-9,17-dione monooxygenase